VQLVVFVADLADRRRQIREQPAPELNQRLAGARGNRAAALTDEQRLPELVFEEEYLPADRGLRDVQLLPGAGERPGFRDRAQNFELPEIHGGGDIILHSAPAGPARGGFSEETDMAEPNVVVPRDLIGFFDYYFVRRAPFQIPDAAREWIVTFGPWITIVLLALFLPMLLVAVGIGAALTPLGGPVYATGFGLIAVLIIANFALMILALPGLFARRASGWNLLFYAELLHIAVSLSNGAIVGGLLGGLIGLYVLFQIRTRYRP
jgi:hypothetical protein